MTASLQAYTSTEWAPRYAVPGDRKWFGRTGAGAVLVHALMEIDPRFPTVTKEQRGALLAVKREFEAQAPEGAATDPFEGEQGRAASDGRNRRESEQQAVAPADGSTSEPGGR